MKLSPFLIGLCLGLKHKEKSFSTKRLHSTKSFFQSFLCIIKFATPPFLCLLMLQQLMRQHQTCQSQWKNSSSSLLGKPQNLLKDHLRLLLIHSISNMLLSGRKCTRTKSKPDIVIEKLYNCVSW